MTQKRKRLFRDTDQKKLGGVCAGLAHYFGWELWVVRIIAITALILSAKVTFVAYVVAWVVLDKASARGEAIAGGGVEPALREETRIERTSDGRTIEVKTKVWEASKLPQHALPDVEQAFANMEASIRAMESYVTSSEFRVRSEINRL